MLEEANEEDLVHDVIFKVGHVNFAAHRYIISNNGGTLQKMMSNDKVVEIKDTHPDIFKEFLLWAYTGDCSLLNLGPCPKHLLNILIPKVASNSLIDNEENQLEETVDVNEVSAFDYYKKNSKNNKEVTSRDAIRLLQEFAKRFEIEDLERRLAKLTIRNGQIDYFKNYTDYFSYIAKKTFNRSHFEDLYDIDVLTKGGHILHAHKCMLVARVEFFQKMYSSRWTTVSVYLCTVYSRAGVVKIVNRFLSWLRDFYKLLFQTMQDLTGYNFSVLICEYNVTRRYNNASLLRIFFNILVLLVYLFCFLCVICYNISICMFIRYLLRFTAITIAARSLQLCRLNREVADVTWSRRPAFYALLLL